MKLDIYQVDAFSCKSFGGNPAAVIPLDEWIDDAIMQNIAMENNLSETAFFVPEDGGFHIRWFTPLSEIDLCGHATLASGYVIFNFLDYKGDSIKFSSKSGPLFVSKNHGLITLDFPAWIAETVSDSAPVEAALGKKPLEVLKTRDIIAVFESENDIRELKPDFSKFDKIDSIGVIATAPGDNSDFVSRFFAPAVGINEDPVTGSAHSSLVPFWAERLGKKELHAFQLSKRGGELHCKLAENRALISGHCVTYMKGIIEF